MPKTTANIEGQPNDAGGMDPRRRAMVIALILFLIFGHLYVVWRKAEIWPFSHYPMYSNIFSRSWHVHEFIGVPLEEPETELVIPYKHIPRAISVRTSLNRMLPAVANGTLDSAVLDDVLRWVGARHELAYTSNLDAPAPLASVRLYQREWRLYRRIEGLEVVETERKLLHETELVAIQ